jgi:hypothetical protein
MECPSCGAHSADDWKELISQVGFSPHVANKHELEVPGPLDESIPLQDRMPEAVVVLDWMVCANKKCHDLVIRMHEVRPRMTKEELTPGQTLASSLESVTETFRVRPRFGVRNLAPEVVGTFRSDYVEASALLDVSPRMSAVLSRKIVHDLIEKFAAIEEFGLAKAIDRFNEDQSRPPAIRENLHYLREIADFSAHTQRDRSGADNEQKRDDESLIIPVTRDDAEWCLDLLDRMFDYLIVGPARDAKLKNVWNEKVKKADRKPLAPGQPKEPLT